MTAGGEAPSPTGRDGQGGATEPLFREEALRHHLRPAEEGEVLRLPPAWARATYWLLLAVVSVGLAYLVLGRAKEYASGPAIIRVAPRIELSSPAGGTVASVEVEPGQVARAGQVLVRLRAEREEAELKRVQEEFELKLADRLRAPGDESAGAVLAALRAELELGRARLEERLVRAPRDGVVRDVRIRPGQLLGAGEPILSLVPAGARFSVIALLPGHFRPQLREGMPLRLELDGHRYAYQWASIRRIADQVIGPAEARRFLGPEIADGVPIDGPVVLVDAELPSATFRARGTEYAYHDGMLARAEAAARTERILFLLLPQLRGLWSS
jgi:membrane fusion protein (multidrug efflux system)